MKRHGNLHARICAIDNLRAAAYNAAKGKRNRREVRAFFANLEAELEALRTELSAGTYRTSPYEIFEKYFPVAITTRDSLAGTDRRAASFSRFSLGFPLPSSKKT